MWWVGVVVGVFLLWVYVMYVYSIQRIINQRIQFAGNCLFP